MNEYENKSEPEDFSLVLGGPLFQIFRRARLSGSSLELISRRIIVITALVWLPLLLLSFAGGHALGGEIKIPFLYDIEAHARFLVALPILIVAELIVHSRLSPVVSRFVERGIIPSEQLPKFYEAINAAKRVRNSVGIEIGLLVLVYTLGIWVWRNEVAVGTASWYLGRPDGLTLAGFWYAFISIPIFQFILVRWYFRFFIWFLFLWRVSRLNIRLIATHPDRSGGIGFLGLCSYGFAPILFAQGALLGGMIANRVLFDGQDLMGFKMEAGGLIAFFVFFILSPLLVFSPKMARAKRAGLGAYGRLASDYVLGFHDKWIDGKRRADEEFLGTGDIQTLADLGNSYSVVGDMKPVPFGLKDVMRLAGATAAPLVPLGLTVFSLEELIGRLIKILF